MPFGEFALILSWLDRIAAGADQVEEDHPLAAAEIRNMARQTQSVLMRRAFRGVVIETARGPALAEEIDLERYRG